MHLNLRTIYMINGYLVGSIWLTNYFYTLFLTFSCDNFSKQLCRRAGQHQWTPSIRRQFQSNGHSSAFPQQLCFQQTEGHCNEDQTEPQIGAAGEQLDVGTVKRFLRDHVAEADRRQGDETEVRSIDDAPVFP